MINYRYEDILAGCGAGIAGTVLGYPLDTLKSTMQVSHVSFFHAGHKIYQTQGIFGFYRGIGSPLLALTILNTVNFSSYSYFSRFYQSCLMADDHNMMWKNMITPLAAMTVGPIASMISTPFEIIKLQLQLNRHMAPSSISSSSSHEIYTGSIHATMRITQKYGFKSLYTGHGINTLREMVFLGSYFTSYEAIKATIQHETSSSSSQSSSSSNSKLIIPFAGGIAGAIGWFISFPLDCVKSRIQGQNLSLQHRIRSYDVFVSLIRSQGIAGLYSGIIPSILRAFIVSSSRFSVYEAILWSLS